ncbi:MAG TPA: cyclophilin-like fold protein [Burkholderiales bacterium]|nr:cyclophilin-like fold protein [Burkholderiales bacterium]
MAKIRISWPGGEAFAQLRDTPTARKVIAALPVTASANMWGEEVYFGLPVTAKLEPDAKQVVDPGSVCFWVEGSALALPFGPTPISTGGECRLVSKCNVLGAIDGDARRLKNVRNGSSIKVEAVE